MFKLQKMMMLLALLSGMALYAEQATIRGDGTMLIEGKPIFPVGLRTEKLDYVKDALECGFNMIMGSGEWELPQYEYAASKDVWIIGGDCYVHFAGIKEGINPKAREDAVIRNAYKNIRDQHKRTIRQALETFGNQPKVIGWVIGDEPEAKSTEVAEAIYEIVKGYMPEKLVFNISCDVRWVPCLLNTADVMIYDRYLLRGTPLSPDKTFNISKNTLTDQLDHTVNIWKDKSCWYMPQLYHPSYFSMKPEELLTLQDLRVQCYLALQCGVKGLIFYTWEELPLTWTKGEDGKRKKQFLPKEKYAEMMSMMKELVAELKSLSPVLCDGRPSREVFVNWLKPGVAGPGSQRIRVLEYYGKQYLIVHNPLDEPMEGVCLGPDLHHANYANTYEGKVITGKNDITLSKHPKGMVQFKIVPNGCGVIELSRTNLMERLGK